MRALRFSGMLALMALGLLIFVLRVFVPNASAQNFAEVKPSPQQVEWQDLEFGVIIHFGPNTFMDREWGDGTARVPDPRCSRARRRTGVSDPHASHRR